MMNVFDDTHEFIMIKVKCDILFIKMLIIYNLQNPHAFFEVQGMRYRCQWGALYLFIADFFAT